VKIKATLERSPKVAKVQNDKPIISRRAEQQKATRAWAARWILYGSQFGDVKTNQ